MAGRMINYTIEFLTDWLAGSGLSSGANADLTPKKDNDGYPFIPGKTLKGLFLDAFKDFQKVDIEGFNEGRLHRMFGKAADENGSTSGSVFFSNAKLSEVEKLAIGSNYVELLYRNIASTAINHENGVASSGSLRVIEVCIPIKLEAYIEGATESDVAYFKKLTQYIRAIGSGRNRGLGRCIIKINA